MTDNAPGNCANFWARASEFSKGNSDGSPEGKAEANDGGAADARLGVAIESIGVDSAWLSPGVCIGKEFREITGVDRGWLSWDVATVIACRLECWKKKIMEERSWKINLWTAFNITNP